MFFSNYGSFCGDHHFSFADRGIALILGRNLDEPRMRSNGAGKSTIGDALEWCLFGEVPRGDTADSIVNAESGKGTSVTVQIVDDEQQLIQVQRTRKVKDAPSGPRVWVNGAELTKLDASETQRVIEGLLGLDRQVFRAAVLFAQGETFTFADATDAQRKEILTKILQLEEIDAWAAHLETMLASENAKLAAIDTTSCTTELRLLAEQNPQERASAWEADFVHRKQQVAQQIQHAEGEVARTQGALSFAQQPQGNSPPSAPQEMAGIDHELSLVVSAILNVNREIGTERGRFRDAQAKLASITEKGTGSCSACGQPITAQHVAHEQALLQQYLSAVETTGKALAAQLAEYEGQRASLMQARQVLDDGYQHQLQQFAASRAVFQKAQQEAQHLASAAQHAADNLARLRTQWSRLGCELNPFLADVARVAARTQQLTEQLHALQLEQAAVEQHRAHLLFWKTGFGPRGLKSYILDARLDEMSTEANRWVQLLTGGTIWVRFETQKAVGKGKHAKLTEQFSVRVFRHNDDGTITERNFRSWSGGEKHRVSLGIDFGLARLVASRSQRSYDLLILDEIFQKSLDTSGKEAVAEMLQHLAREKSSILVVDHDVVFQGLFEEVIVVEKHHGRSRIVPGGSA